MSPPPELPLYLPGEEPAYAVLHRPEPGTGPGTAVLIVPPWGWDEVASYRSRRASAQQLARAGHPTLRIDLPATGDSAGAPTDPDRASAWTAAVRGACDWLRASSGSPRLALVGLGLGGLVAGRAVAEGAAVDDLVLWCSPSKGRALVRELRAFARLQDSGYPERAEPGVSDLPEGWLESGGFVLSQATLEALLGIDLTRIPARGLRRALLLDRDGMAVDPALRSHLEEEGVEVAEEPGHGWGAMVAHPEHSEAPEEVFERVAAWLAKAGDVTDGGGSGPGEQAAEPALALQGVRETQVSFAGPSGRLRGVLAEPAGAAAPELCAVLLNAGAVRRTGPNRMWVEVARRWAQMGVRNLRFDLDGIGDADGDGRRFAEVGEFYRPEVGEQIRSVLDDLEARGLGSRFVLGGLCAGGYWSFNAAIDDERVRAALLLNAGALFWHDELAEQRRGREITAVLRPARFGKLIRGQVSLATVGNVASGLWRIALRALSRLPARVRGEGGKSRVGPGEEEEAFARLERAGTRVVMAFSGGEPLRDEIERSGLAARLAGRPNVELGTLPGRDHTMRSIPAQRAVHELLDRELRRQLEYRD